MCSSGNYLYELQGTESKTIMKTVMEEFKGFKEDTKGSMNLKKIEINISGVPKKTLIHCPRKSRFEN